MPRGIPNSKSDSTVQEIEQETSDHGAQESAPIPAAAKPDDATVVKRSWMSGARVRMIVHSGESDLSKAPVFVSVNDYDAQFPRDTEVLLPEEAAAQIENAVFDHLVRDREGNIVNRPVRRFQYTIIERIPA